MHAKGLLEEAWLQATLPAPAFVSDEKRSQVGANGRRGAFPDQGMSGDTTPLQVGETLGGKLFQLLVIRIGVRIERLETSGCTQVLEEALKDAMDQRTTFQWVDGPAVLRAVSRVDAQDPSASSALYLSTCHEPIECDSSRSNVKSLLMLGVLIRNR